MPRDYKYRINIRDIDFSRRASLTTICDYVIQAASEDASVNEAGVDRLYSQSLAWVLMRMAVEVKRYPYQLENITISTWVESIDKLMVRRNMIITGEDGEEIGLAVTYWCIINFENRTSQNCREFPQFFKYIEPIPSKLSAPERIRVFEGDNVAAQKVRYSHIDFNEHTNTTKYIGWMFNTMTYEEMKKYDPLRIDVNFLHESKYNDMVTIVRKKNGDDHLFLIVNNETSKPVCTAKIKWMEKA